MESQDIEESWPENEFVATPADIPSELDLPPPEPAQTAIDEHLVEAATRDDTVSAIEEAQLFVEACHACHARLTAARNEDAGGPSKLEATGSLPSVEAR